MDCYDVVEAIKHGDFDKSEMNKIVEAIKTRRSYESFVKTTMFEVGDYAFFNENSNPAYLQGLQVKVKKVNRKTIGVDFDDVDSAGRFRGAKNVRVPSSMLDKF